MKLKYLPLDAQNLINKLNENVSKSNQIVEEFKHASNNLKTVVEQKKLDGKAYNRGLELFRDCIIPTLNNVTDAILDIKSECEKFEVLKNQMPNELLDEDALEKKIKLLEENMSATQKYLEHLTKVNQDETQEKIKEGTNELQNNIDDYQHQIDVLTSKLQKLQEFDNQSSQIFNKSLEELKIGMQGIAILNETKINANGSFTLPEGIDKTWFTKFKQTQMSKSELQKLADILGLGYDEAKNFCSTLKKHFDNNDFELQRITNILKAISVGNISQKEFLKYGEQGKMAFKTLNEQWRFLRKQIKPIWNELKTNLKKSKNPWVKAIVKTMNETINKTISNNVNGSFNNLLRNFDKVKNLKGVGRYTKPLSTVMEWCSDLVKNTVTKVAEHAPFLKGFFRAAGGVASKIGWAGMVLSAGYDFVEGYNKTNGDLVQKIGKGVVHAGVGTISNIGPLEGAVIGATGGPIDIVTVPLGFVAGSANALWGMINPKGKKAFYDGLENILDNGVDAIDNAGKEIGKGAKNVGNALHGAWNNVTSFFNWGNH